MDHKPIAILFSDLHIGEYAKFNAENRRTLNHFRVLFFIRKLAIKYGVPVIHGGDLFHKPEVMSNELLSITTDMFRKLDSKKWVMYSISGNHDCSLSNTEAKQSPSWVKSFSRGYDFLHCLDMQTISINSNGVPITLSGIPYMDHNIGLNKVVTNLPTKPNHILVIHSDYPGAKDTDGTEVGQVENLNINLLNNFKLVVIGHIHKPQRLSKKVYMIGAPLQQRRTDRDCDLGYWMLMDNFTMKFVAIDKFPKFIDVTREEDILDDGNYYTLVVDHSADKPEVVNHGIDKYASKTKIARRYLKLKGITDDKRKKALLRVLKDVE